MLIDWPGIFKVCLFLFLQITKDGQAICRWVLAMSLIAHERRRTDDNRQMRPLVAERLLCRHPINLYFASPTALIFVTSLSIAFPDRFIDQQID
jgi:hypothetical protein